MIDVARQNDLTPSEVQEMGRYLPEGRGSKASRQERQEPKTRTNSEIKELKATIGDLYVENAILKKAKALWGIFGRDRILTLQSELLEEGIRTSLRTDLRTCLGYNRSNVYYTPETQSEGEAGIRPMAG